MLKPEQVPEAVAYEVYRRFEMDTEREAAEAIAAALNAWPGMNEAEVETPDGSKWLQSIILPLTETSTKENDNG